MLTFCFVNLKYAHRIDKMIEWEKYLVVPKINMKFKSNQKRRRRRSRWMCSENLSDGSMCILLLHRFFSSLVSFALNTCNIFIYFSVFYFLYPLLFVALCEQSSLTDLEFSCDCMWYIIYILWENAYTTFVRLVQYWRKSGHIKVEYDPPTMTTTTN